MRFWMALLALAVLVQPVVAQEHHAALVTSFSGSGTYTRDQYVQPLHSVMILEPNDIVELKAGAVAHFSFLKDGHITVAKGPVKLQVEKAGAKLLSGTPPEKRRRDGRTIVPAGANLERMAGQLLFSKYPPKEGSPLCDFDHLWTINPVLSWTSGTPPFKITVFDPEGKAVWSATTNARSLPYAGPALTPDQNYTAEVSSKAPEQNDTAEFLSEPLMSSANFRIVSKATLDKISATERWVDDALMKRPDDLTPLVVLMALYNENEMLEEAIVVARKGVKIRPNDPGINFALANLLGIVERHEEAGLFRQKGQQLMRIREE